MDEVVVNRSGSGLIARVFSDADKAEWSVLCSQCKKCTPYVMEWYKAVAKIKKTGLYLLEHRTWQDFCANELGRNARAVGHLLQGSESRAFEGESAESQPSSTPDTYDGRTECSEKICKRLTSVFKALNFELDRWPEDNGER